MFIDTSSDRIEVDNGRFRLVLTRRDGLYQQAIYAHESTARPILVSQPCGLQTDRAITSPPYDQATVERSDDRVVIRLRGHLGPHTLEGAIEVHAGEDYLQYRVVDTLKGAVTLETLQSCYELGEQGLDFCFAPYLRPEPDHVIGHQAFKSPALIMQKGGVLTALIPDVALLAEEFPKQKMEVCLELDADPQTVKQPVFGYGFKRHAPHGLLYFRHTPEMLQQFNDAVLRYGYYIFVKADAEEQSGYQHVVRFLWDKFGKAYMAHVLPQTISFDRYAELGMNYAFRNLWAAFEVEGVQCGAMLSGIRYPNDVWFHSSYNQLRTAYHFYWFGKKWSRPDLIHKAHQIKNLLLLSPRNRGAFSTLFERKVWFGRPLHRWVSSTHWNSEEFAALHAQQGHPMVVRGLPWDKLYQTASCSAVAAWMLKWWQELEQDGRLLERARQWGDLLVEVQLPSGAIPAWLDGETFKPEETLKESVDGACSGWFLAELFRVTKDRKYLRAAEKVGEFIATRIMARQKWQDFETFFDSMAKPMDFFDPHTQQYLQNTFGLYWTTLLFRSLYAATHREEHLRDGCKALDYLCLFQAVWNTPYMGIHTFGGFEVANGHPIWSDARTGLIAPVLLDYYEITGMTEYFERGVAAIRNMMGMMFVPENKAVTRHYNRGPLGSSDEAYSHRGEDTPWTGTSYDWGVGTNLNAIAHLEELYGDVYVDLDRMVAFGLDGCIIRDLRVEGNEVRIELADKVNRSTPLLVKMRNLALDGYSLRINGGEPHTYSKQELLSGIRVSLAASSY